jgi:hypothetical protein
VHSNASSSTIVSLYLLHVLQGTFATNSGLFRQLYACAAAHATNAVLCWLLDYEFEVSTFRPARYLSLWRTFESFLRVFHLPSVDNFQQFGGRSL